ncbi:hypothetical protein FKM82_011278 [Ascaphus truei]
MCWRVYARMECVISSPGVSSMHLLSVLCAPGESSGRSGRGGDSHSDCGVPGQRHSAYYTAALLSPTILKQFALPSYPTRSCGSCQ